MNGSVSIGCGFLAVWTEVDSAATGEYLEWLTREHLHERVSLRGFRAARVHRDAEGASRFFVCYETDSVEALGAPEYLARLNHPSEWSRRMNPQLRGTVRGVGSGRRMGSGFGAEIATMRDRSGQLRAALEDSALPSIAAIPGISGLFLLDCDGAITQISTTERGLRHGADGAFDQALVLEAMSAEALASAMCRLTSELGSALLSALDIARYRLIHGLEARWFPVTA
jgi:hypothetical protein